MIKKYTKKKTPIKSAPSGWNKTAPFFREMFEGDDSLQKTVILPNLKRLLNPQKDDVLLDLGCGAGFFAGAFSDAVGRLIGADSSSELVARAKETVPGAEFHVSGSDKLLFLKDGSLDKVMIVLALQNIEKARETLEECAKKLKAGGRLFLVINHPAFRVPKKSSWGFDAGDKIQYRRVDEYMSESRAEILMKPGSDRNITTFSYHRPLQFYFKIFSKAGLLTERLEEWMSDRRSGPGARADAENKARREFPLFMAIVARKEKE